jgi:hypothetical protein
MKHVGVERGHDGPSENDAAVPPSQGLVVHHRWADWLHAGHCDWGRLVFLFALDFYIFDTAGSRG